MPQGIQGMKIKKRLQEAIGDGETVRHYFIGTLDKNMYAYKGAVTGVFGMLNAPTLALAATDEAIYVAPMPKGARGLKIDAHSVQRVDKAPENFEADWGRIGLKSLAITNANVIPLEGHGRAAKAFVRFIEAG